MGMEMGEGAEVVGASFGALVRHHRLRAGLTQERLAERARLSARAVADLERLPARRPRLDTAALLADALGLGGPERAAFLALARGDAPTPPTPTSPPTSPPTPPTPPFEGRLAIKPPARHVTVRRSGTSRARATGRRGPVAADAPPTG